MKINSDVFNKYPFIYWSKDIKSQENIGRSFKNIDFTDQNRNHYRFNQQSKLKEEDLFVSIERQKREQL